MSSLAAKQDETLERNREEIERAVVTSGHHDPSKTLMYIEEYSALLEKYTAACVVRNSAKVMAVKVNEGLEKRVQ